MKRKPRKWKMWAVVDDDGLAVWDYRAPITWLRRLAIRDKQTMTFDGKVIRVEVREIMKKKP